MSIKTEATLCSVETEQSIMCLIFVLFGFFFFFLGNVIDFGFEVSGEVSVGCTGVGLGSWK